MVAASYFCTSCGKTIYVPIPRPPPNVVDIEDEEDPGTEIKGEKNG
jgi:hypothetical protein